MICLVLAGGSGDRLWPLSRKNYPKQFINLVGSHSLFQEAIVRNMPYCDEFWVFTAQQYRPIVQGQLQVFQGLRYRCFCEEEGRRTMPALVLACLCANPSEKFLVVSTDHVVEGEGYKEAVVQGREALEQGWLCCVGVRALGPTAGCGFLRSQPGGRVEYRYAADIRQAQDLLAQDGWLWDTGILMGRAGDFLREAQLHCPQLCERLRQGIKGLDLSAQYRRIPAGLMKAIEPLGLGEALTAQSARMKLLRGSFLWRRVVDLESLLQYDGVRQEGQVLQWGCENLSVLNRVPDKLIVANGLKDISLVDTPDALYIARTGRGGEIRDILADSPQGRPYLEKGRAIYAGWGTRRLLRGGAGYQVEEVTVLQGCRWGLAPAEGQSCQCTLLKGRGTFQSRGRARPIETGAGFSVGGGQRALVANEGDEPLVLLVATTGDPAQPGEAGAPLSPEEDFAAPEGCEEIVRLEPAFHDNLWGGVRLRELYHKRCDYEQIGESWELSAHEAGQSTVATGRFRGLPFGEYLRRIGRESWGWKCRHAKSFPLLIKLIDARQALSIQVHPDDEYALRHENSYGKNEMWYILDCAPGASLYCGFERPISVEEIARRVEEGSLQEVLHKIPAQKGMTVWIPSGTVHAIGAGILLCEVQQSSDLTYRLYDYGRRDKFGQPRPLHKEKALRVLTPGPLKTGEMSAGPAGRQAGEDAQELCNCKYFWVNRRQVQGSCSFMGSEASFMALMFLEGSGTVRVGQTRLPYQAADCFFVPARLCQIEIEGSGSLLQVQV